MSRLRDGVGLQAAMKPSWVGRQIVVLLLVGLVAAGTAAVLMLISSTRFAVRLADTEANLLGGTIWREIAELVEERRPASVGEVAGDPGLETLVRDAMARTHSILYAAVLDPEGLVAAHSLPSRLGTREPEYPTLPDSLSYGEILTTLWQLRHSTPTYRKDFPVEVGDRPFATVRITLGGAFMWDSVMTAVSRGLLAAFGLTALAMIMGILFARFINRRFRALEQGIRALSEGHYDALPASGVDEFDRLARALNVLGARLNRTDGGDGIAPESRGGIGAGDQAVLDGQSRAVARLGEAAAGVAHELRNQLQVVQLDLDLLRHAETKDPDTIRRHAESAARGMEGLDAAIRGFLKIAGLRPPHLRPVNVNELLGEIRSGFLTEAGLAGVSVDLDLDPSVPVIQADPEILRQAMQNIIRNALQALTSTEEGRIVIASSRNQDDVKIVVADNGPGIPPQIREKVFDLFFTTRADGSGVGLALVRQSIEMHGGRVEVDARAEGGTEVVLEVPCRQA